MSDYMCFLITQYYNRMLIKSALKVHVDKLPPGIQYKPNCDGSKKALLALLPLHVASCGVIVDVELIFEVAVVE